jgi:hypothetical protein
MYTFTLFSQNLRHAKKPNILFQVDPNIHYFDRTSMLILVDLEGRDSYFSQTGEKPTSKDL